MIWRELERPHRSKDGQVACTQVEDTLTASGCGEGRHFSREKYGCPRDIKAGRVTKTCDPCLSP